MSLNPSRDDFAALLDESLGGRDFMEGAVVKGKVVGVEKDFAIIDVGLKTEGRVLLKEFGLAEDGKSPIRWATPSKSSWSASRTPWAKRSSAATRPAARKPGPVWKASTP